MADGKQQEAWRAYLELALGLTEASRKRAQKVAKRLTGRGGATAQQLQSFADNLFSANLANREALIKLVRFEVDKAIGALGLATAEEVTDLQARIRDLERQLHDEQALRASAVAAPTPAAAAAEPLSAPGAAPVKKAAAKRAAAKSTVAKKAVVKKTTSTPAVVKKTTATKAVVKKAPAKTVVAKKAAPPAGSAAE